MRTWVDASTLIALDVSGEALVLRELLGRVAITKQVHNEVFNGRESKILQEGVGDRIEIIEVGGDFRRWTTLGLGRGEASLFLTPPKDRLVPDEVPARTVAESEGRDYIGLIGLLLVGFHSGILSKDRIRGIIGRLVRSGFHLSIELYDGVLRELEADR